MHAAWRGMLWRDMVWCGTCMAWHVRGVVWRGVAWCGVASRVVESLWRSVASCGVAWRVERHCVVWHARGMGGMVWLGVARAWCGVV